MRGISAIATWVFLGALAAQSASAQPAMAVWKERELNFAYHGFTTTYSCDGLKYKLRIILEALGARPGFKVLTSGCEIGGGVARFPRARMQVAFPEPLSAGVSETGMFPAGMATVTIRPRNPRELEEGDCELVEQVRDSLLPEIGVRVLKDDTACVPHQKSLGRPLLVVEILRAEPASMD
jgi:hypothetical protein